MTEHFTREEAEKYGVLHIGAVPTSKYLADIYGMLNAAVTAKLKEWEAQGPVAKAVVLTTGIGLQWIGEALPASTKLYTHALPAQPAEPVNAELLAALINLDAEWRGFNEDQYGLQGKDDNNFYTLPAVKAALFRTHRPLPASVNEELVQELTLAASTLRSYEAQHRAKDTLESLAKAEVNNTLATRFEAALASAKALHPVGEVVVTWDEQQRRILAVTRQDDEGRTLKVIAQAPKETLAEWAVQATPEEIDRADWRIAAAGLRKAIAELESSGCTRSDLRVYLAIADDHGRRG